MWASGQLHTPAALSPEENPSIHRTGGWVCPIDGLDDTAVCLHGVVVRDHCNFPSPLFTYT